jgi:lactoylglutathione lyase
MSNIHLNLVVLRSPDIERAVQFYRSLGLSFEQHRHGNGPEHYAAEMGNMVFEIYPRRNEGDNTNAVRIGFRVQSLEKIIAAAQEAGGQIVSAPQVSEWGRRAVLDDPDGHRVELIEAVS